ncbi:hypothetical protein JTE90_012031 [Oedothorax gibbosus]|uniref:Uncharacterized protein n=1 Tax=Oedothorax gibbosus TaxID=931172 RepID=A0AAV6UDC5_9ARAC|nr:hypothetical protein JTE90_012031 [Oedothorax gibbosus]
MFQLFRIPWGTESRETLIRRVGTDVARAASNTPFRTVRKFGYLVSVLIVVKSWMFMNVEQKEASHAIISPCNHGSELSDRVSKSDIPWEVAYIPSSADTQLLLKDL